jgi:hypothetical protein
MPPASDNVCKWVNRHAALQTFATYTGPTQSQLHIKPLHHYVACRLVLEGGFPPEDITPRPPFRIEKGGSDGWLLVHDEKVATGGERTLLGGLKTKTVDIVIVKNGLVPTMAISCKGAIGAFRNLTNRMEEAVGDCTNLHITYPAMVTGFLFVMRAHTHAAWLAATTATTGPSNRGRAIAQNDIAIQASGEPVEAIVRFHNALRELTGRPSGPNEGNVLSNYPVEDSPLRIDRFFETLYLRYDERYVYSAPDLKRVTRRREWSPKSPVFDRTLMLTYPAGTLDYQPRIKAPDSTIGR